MMVWPARTAAGWMSMTDWQTLARKARASTRARSDRAMSGLKPQAMRLPACSSLSVLAPGFHRHGAEGLDDLRAVGRGSPQHAGRGR